MNILDYKYDKYTTTGNDGIIEFILKTSNIKEGLFVEFGAWDGIKGSNCRKLFEENWSGLFIEVNENRFSKLVENYKDFDRIKCCNSKIGFVENELFDNVVDPYLEEKNIDFCSIDIDGLDLEVFETFEKYLPNIVCIEGGQMLYPYHNRISKRISKKNIQQSLKVFNETFTKKGYKLLCTYQDSFFIKNELFNLFDVSENLLDQYFDGLLAIPRRLPYIQTCLKDVKLKNKIIDYILSNSNYSKYKWSGRKQWVKNEYDKIVSLINTARKIEKNNEKI